MKIKLLYFQLTSSKFNFRLSLIQFKMEIEDGENKEAKIYKKD